MLTRDSKSTVQWKQLQIYCFAGRMRMVFLLIMDVDLIRRLCAQWPHFELSCCLGQVHKGRWSLLLISPPYKSLGISLILISTVISTALENMFESKRYLTSPDCLPYLVLGSLQLPKRRGKGFRRDPGLKMHHCSASRQRLPPQPKNNIFLDDWDCIHCALHF